MPFINKRDIHNWYNTIPVRGADARKWEYFSADRLEGNEIRCGDVIIAKIPNIPGRISRKKRTSVDGKHVTTYIELILERRYDPEKQQMRNRRVTIGIDINHIFAGMMIINEKYHRYFDREGKLKSQPEGFAGQAKTAEKQASATPAQTAEKQASETQTIPAETAKTAETEKQEETKPVRVDEQRKTGPARREETGSMNGEAEDRETEEENEEAQRESEHIRFLESMLHKYTVSIQDQARKRPDKRVSGYQVRRINEILKELRDYFSPTDASDYLELAEEPDEEGNGLTYTDMEILLHAYSCTLADWWMGRLWTKR